MLSLGILFLICFLVLGTDTDEDSLKRRGSWKDAEESEKKAVISVLT